jgi:hypothetical protein
MLVIELLQVFYTHRGSRLYHFRIEGLEHHLAPSVLDVVLDFGLRRQERLPLDLEGTLGQQR